VRRFGPLVRRRNGEHVLIGMLACLTIFVGVAVVPA